LKSEEYPRYPYRDITISVRVSDKEFEEIREIAKKRFGGNISEAIRYYLRGARLCDLEECPYKGTEEVEAFYDKNKEEVICVIPPRINPKRVSFVRE